MEDTFIDKLVQEDSVSAIRRLVVGGLLAASAPFGVPAVLAMGVACIAINATVFSYEKRAQQKQLLDFYRDEIAAVTHCSPTSQTIDDLKRVAAPVSEGGSNITAIKQELDEMNAQQRVRFGLSSIW